MGRMQKLGISFVFACLALSISIYRFYTHRTDVELDELPETIWPRSYNITLRPRLLHSDGKRRFTFDAEVYIEIVSTVNTSRLALHTQQLNYTLRELRSLDYGAIRNRQRPLLVWTEQSSKNLIIYHLAYNLVAGRIYQLHFKYSGILSANNVGFFYNSYLDEDNVTRWFAATQLEPRYARCVFPSFDEPKFKAVYTLTIIRPSNMTSFSNARLRETIDHGNYISDVYAPTPPMSSYLLSCLVGHWVTRFDGRLGVIARSAAIARTDDLIHLASRILDIYGDYFGIGYYEMGLDKLHVATLPNFSFVAMENWGLVVCRERIALISPHSNTLRSQQYLISIFAHELAHMWFGNLVTCYSWNYLWLNEGLAYYFHYFGAAWLNESLQLDAQFVVDELQNVMQLDADRKMKALNGTNTFNSICYRKGAAFVRMIRHAMGEKRFRNSLQTYLKEYFYRSVVPENLFKHWQANWPAVTKTYTDGLFKSFTEQVGYPLVSVKVADDKKGFTISQKRFLLKDNDDSDASLRYTIPITYTTDQDKKFTNTTPALFIQPSPTENTISFDKNIEWVILNIQETGYYRVNYDEANWRALSKALSADNWSGIHELNRAQIVDDLLNLARAGLIKYEFALEILEYLMTETNYLPWTSAFNGYSYLAIRLGEDTKHFSQYILELTEKSYKNFGFEEKSSDKPLDIYNRAKVLSWSCKYGNEECQIKVREYFNKMSSEAVPVNIRSVVYCNALRFGTEADYDKLFNKYKTETVATEETLILNSLGCVKDSKLVEKHFNVILSTDVRRQDKSSALSSLYTENSENVTPVFELVTKNFAKLAEAMGGYSAVATVIFNIATHFTEENQQSNLKQFNDKNKPKFGSSGAALETAEKTVEENFRWCRSKIYELKSYLIKRSQQTADS